MLLDSGCKGKRVVTKTQDNRSGILAVKFFAVTLGR